MRLISGTAVDLYTLLPLKKGSRLGLLNSSFAPDVTFPLDSVHISSLSLSESVVQPFDSLWVPEADALEASWVIREAAQSLKEGGRLLFGVHQRSVQGKEKSFARSWEEMQDWLPKEGWEIEQSYLVRYSLREPRFLIPILNGLEAVHYDQNNMITPYSFPAFLQYWVRRLGIKGKRDKLPQHPLIVVWRKREGG